MRSKEADFGPEKAYFRLKIADLRLKITSGGEGDTRWRTKNCPMTNHRSLAPPMPLPNQSPKGNMWSAIPFALLCMIVNLSEQKQGSGPEGDEVL